jgi:hypothetical protein
MQNTAHAENTITENASEPAGTANGALSEASRLFVWLSSPNVSNA